MEESKNDGIEEPAFGGASIQSGATENMGMTSSPTLTGIELVILFGSNMGTSEDFAERLKMKAIQLGMKCESILSLDDFLTTFQQDESFITENKLFVIITSTYNGNPPDNAVEFADFISSSSTNDIIFQSMKYCVFGCGNTLWDKTYQFFPSLINEKLESFGATRILEQGKGDADKDIDDDFQNFMTSFFISLCPDIQESIAAESYETKYEITNVIDGNTIENMKNLVSDIENRDCLNSSVENAKTIPVIVKENRELVHDVGKAGRSVRHIEFELPQDITYRTGDHLVAYGSNEATVVEKAGNLLGYTGNNIDQLITIRPSGKFDEVDKGNGMSTLIPFDLPVKVSTILSRCVELQTPATRYQILYLASRAMCPPEKIKLEVISGRSKSNIADNSNDKKNKNLTYEEYILKPRRTILELLQEFKSVQLNLTDFLTLATPMKARFYSISSSNKANPRRFSITVGVVEGEAPVTKRYHYGTCSYHLSRFVQGRNARCVIKDTGSTFRLPKDSSVPIIMVGPGTGIAPLMGFLQERAYDSSSNPQQQGNPMDNCMLFFGCRNDDDYLYKNELKKYGLNNLYVAFSRKQGIKKTYVQHLISKHSASVFDFISRGAHIYICGDASHMAPDVKDAFINAIMNEGKMSIDNAKDMINRMIAKGQYSQDVWASA